MEKRKFIKLSIYSFSLSIVSFLLTYFVFHFVTDEGITFAWHEEAGKPFVTNMLGVFSVLLLFMGVASLLIMHVFCDKNNK